MHDIRKASKIRPSKLIIGVIFMVIHAIAMSAIYIVGKKLTKVLHPTQVAFLYKASVLMCILPLYLGGGIIKNLSTSKLTLHFARSICSMAGTICFYFGLMNIKAADAAAITYLEQCIVLAVGILYFKEAITTAKIALIVLGLAGACCVIKPGLHQFNSSYIYLFLALIFWAMNNTSVKVLGKTEKTKTQMFYLVFFSTIMSLPLAMQYSWKGLNLQHMQYVVILGILHIVHTICFFRAFKFAEMSVVMPFDYTRLIFTGVFGYVYLGETADRWELIGYALIAIGGILLICDETRKRGWSRESEEKFFKSKSETEKVQIKN